MNLNDIISKIKEEYNITKVVKVNGIEFEIKPLTISHETKLLESVKGKDNVEFVAEMKKQTLASSITRINDIDLKNPDMIIECTDAKGNKITKTKFLYLYDFINDLPSTFANALFDAYTDMMAELEKKMSDNIKYEKYIESSNVEVEKKIPDELNENE